MSAPDMHMKGGEEESKHLDSTIPEYSTTHSVKEEGREEREVRRPLTAAPISPPCIDYSSASNEIDGNVYLAYAFPRPRRDRTPNVESPDYRKHPEYTHRAKVVTWDQNTGFGSLLELQSSKIINVGLKDIMPDYGALIVGTEVIFQMYELKFYNFWVNDDRYYVLYHEAAICEARYPYMREDNESIGFDPNRDYFRRPELNDKDINTHMEVFSIRHND